VHAAVSRLPAAQQQIAYEGQPTLRWIAFRQYSLRDFMRLAYNAARAVHPSLPRGEGLRRIGWMSYPSFAATMAGRVVLFAFGDRIENVLTAAAKSYRLALPCANITTERVDERHYRLLMRDVPSFAETMHCGVLEGAIKEHGFEPEMLVRRGATPADVDFDIRWR